MCSDEVNDFHIMTLIDYYLDEVVKKKIYRFCADSIVVAIVNS